MLTEISKGKFKWELTESPGTRYTKNDLMFILAQMDHKLDEVDWETISDDEANELAWIARELTEKAIELIEK